MHAFTIWRVKPDNVSCAFALLVLRLTLGGRWYFSNRVLKFGFIITLLQGVIISVRTESKACLSDDKDAILRLIAAGRCFVIDEGWLDSL